MTAEQIAKYRRFAIKNNLIGANILKKYKCPQLVRICNGIGGDQMPQMLNNAITKLNPSLVVCSIIHDVQWFESNGTLKSFLKTNAEFEVNGILSAKINYPRWWQWPLRKWVERKGRTFRDILDQFAFEHYRECYHRKGNLIK